MLLLPITTVLLSPVVTLLLLCCSVATGTSCLTTITTVSFFGCVGVVVRGVVVRGVVVRGGVVRGLLSHGHLLLRAVSQLSRR